MKLYSTHKNHFFTIKAQFGVKKRVMLKKESYMLSIISQNYNNKNYLQNIFKKQRLDIAIQQNMKRVNYLYVTFNSNDASCRPYHKRDSNICFAHKDSNPPPSIFQQFVLSIENK